MSILQISPSGSVSAMLHALLKEKPAKVVWPNYVSACDQLGERQIDHVEQILNKKRVHALKYLGSKTRSYDEYYSKAEPRVFTAEFVLALSTGNSVRRIKRNPWLEVVLNGVREGGSPAASAKGNVLPFGPHIVVQSGTVSMPA